MSGKAKEVDRDRRARKRKRITSTRDESEDELCQIPSPPKHSGRKVSSLAKSVLDKTRDELAAVSTLSRERHTPEDAPRDSVRIQARPAPGYIHLQPTDFERHKLWFPDGSLLIQLNRMRFRLHQSRLTSASLFFQELFRIRELSWEVENTTISLMSGDSADVPVTLEEVHGTDLFTLDEVGVSLADFEILMEVLDNGVAYCRDVVPFSTLASVIRAATTLRCAGILAWAVAGVEKQWASRSFLEHIPDASECFILTRKYTMSENTTTRALYELLRTAEVTDISHLLIPHKPFLDARKKLNEAWLSVATSAPESAVPCPSISSGVGAVQLCISSSSEAAARRVHLQLVRKTLLQRHLWDPIGGLESLISMDEVWNTAGYCLGCVHLRKRLWASKKEKLIQDLVGWFKELR
ncbi:hypothetical protein DFH09DRAFT_1397662 [Mycena vulgaris]|nr:hypothetical protein DFH09DRAFT_1397662 [Mycena vulgaris]